MRGGLFLIFLSLNLSFSIGEMRITAVDVVGAVLPLDISLQSTLYFRTYDYTNPAFTNRYKCVRVNEFTKAPTRIKFRLEMEATYLVKFGQDDEIFNSISVTRKFDCEVVDAPRRQHYTLQINDAAIKGENYYVSCEIHFMDNEFNFRASRQIEKRLSPFYNDLNWRLECGLWVRLRNYINFAKHAQCQYESNPNGRIGSTAKNNFENYEAARFSNIQEQTVPNCEENISDEDFETLLTTLSQPKRNMFKNPITLGHFILYLQEHDGHILFYYDDKSYPKCIDSEKLISFYNTELSQKSVLYPEFENKKEVLSKIFKLLKDPSHEAFSARHYHCIFKDDIKQFSFYILTEHKNEGDEKFVVVDEVPCELLTYYADAVDTPDIGLPESQYMQCVQTPARNSSSTCLNINELKELIKNEVVFYGVYNSNLKCYDEEEFLAYLEEQIKEKSHDFVSFFESQAKDINYCNCSPEKVKQIEITHSTDSGSTVFKELTSDLDTTNSQTYTVLNIPLTKNEEKNSVNDLNHLWNLLNGKYFIMYNGGLPICHSVKLFKLYADNLASMNKQLPLSPEDVRMETYFKLIVMLGIQNRNFSSKLDNCLRMNYARRVTQFELGSADIHYTVYNYQFELTINTINRVMNVITHLLPTLTN